MWREQIEFSIQAEWSWSGKAGEFFWASNMKGEVCSYAHTPCASDVRMMCASWILAFGHSNLYSLRRLESNHVSEVTTSHFVHFFVPESQSGCNWELQFYNCVFISQCPTGICSSYISFDVFWNCESSLKSATEPPKSWLEALCKSGMQARYFKASGWL